MIIPGRKKAIWIAVGLLIIVSFGYRVFWYRPPVTVIVVKKVEIKGKVHGPGTVQSKVGVTVSAKITGILEKLYADQGSRVKKGQLLAELDISELRARAASAREAENRARHDLSRAKAALQKAEASLVLAQSNYQRNLDLLKPGYISQADFDNTKAALKVAESEVKSSQSDVEAFQAQVAQAESETHAAEAVFAYTRILAPMDGLITVRKAEVGDTIAPGTPIFQMVDYQIWAASWIDETKVAQLREGQKASIKLRSGRDFQGEVVRLNKEADTVTRELEVDVKFDTLPNPLVIGEETEVDIDTGSQTGPAVPLSAIVERNGSKGVMVVSNGLTSFRPITLGLQDVQRASVLDGLKEGETVILNPAGIETGKKVRPEIKTDTAKKNQ
jgi:multidrug efflux pump subunit AcrA (membrane-fusion protein)